MYEDYDTDEMLDRLIDGELSPDDRRRVLAALETSVDGWRRCALGFVEAQTWRGEMRRLLSDGAHAVNQNTRPTSNPNLTQLKPNPVHAPSRSAAVRHNAPWLAAAAGLLIAFGLGWQLRGPQSTSSFEAPLAVTPPQVQPPQRRVPSADAVTLVLNDSQGAQHRVEVPLVEARNLGRQFSDVPRWTPSSAVRRSLDAQGVDLKTRRRYAPLYFEQENQVVPMVVPVDDAYVTPVNRTVF